MSKPVRKEQKYLDPAWLRDTAALAMKRGTSVIISKTRRVYGFLPKGGGSVIVFYPGNDEWIDAVLELCPNGAVFPDNTIFGGANAVKSLRAYANVRLPDEGGKAWIDPVTSAVHVRGIGATVHSACIAANDTPVLTLPGEVSAVDIAGPVTPQMAKLMTECTRVDQNRPALSRIVTFVRDGETWLAASDGKSAVMRRCAGLPETFSCNPQIVGLLDVAAYGESKDASGNAVTTYSLKDGTLVLERTGPVSVPNYSQLLDNTLENDSGEFVGSLVLDNLLEEIASMGLAAYDSQGGCVSFSPGKTEVIRDGVPIAEFDAVADFSRLESKDPVTFAVPMLKRLAVLGGGFSIGKSGSPALASSGEAYAFAMPVTIKR